jgi:signal transduction histidine kinase
LESTTDRLPQRIYYIASGLYIGAVFLRSFLIFRDTPVLIRVLALLSVWVAFFLSEPAISRIWSQYFPIYLVIQSSLVFFLLTTPGFADFYATLLQILSMQGMARLNPKIGALWIALYALFMILLFENDLGIFEALALTLVYTAGNVFLGAYSLAIRRAEAAHKQNQALASELGSANLQLDTYSSQLAHLAVVRERNRLARELHDSVTQTVFSMTLTAQSVRLLLDRDRGQVGVHLDRLNQLAQSALSEMQTLISELKPDRVAWEGLAESLRRHISGSRISDSLLVLLEVEGDQSMEVVEEQGLFHIAVEAINNIVKHAQTSCATIRLHLAEPFWMEISDQGKGFDLRQAQSGERVGLSGMRERAEEIGWNLQIMTSTGAGTCIRVEKFAVREERV